jgi:hypothetical protein
LVLALVLGVLRLGAVQVLELVIVLAVMMI